VPNVQCYDDRQVLVLVHVDPRAAILLGRYGVDPCDVPHPGDEVRPQDAENYLREHHYIA